MDVLKQFFDVDGKIISSGNGLDTKSFYENVLCRYRFNEMFCSVKNDNGVGYSVGEGIVLFSWNENFGGLPFAIDGFPYNSEIIIRRCDNNNRNAWTCAVGNYLTLRTGRIENIVKNKSFEILYKVKFYNPSNNDGIMFELHDYDEISYGGSFLAGIDTWVGTGSTSINCNGSNIDYFMYDDAAWSGDLWHTLNLQIKDNGDAFLYLDNMLAASGTADRSRIDSSSNIQLRSRIFNDTFVDSILMRVI